MRKPYTINRRKVSVPTSWADLTVKEFSAIMKHEGSEIRLISAILDYPEEVISKSPPELFDPVLLDLTFMSRPIDFAKIKMKEKINIGGKEYPTPHNIKFSQDFTFGRKVELNEVIKSHMKIEGEDDKGQPKGFFDIYSAIPEICAIWYFPIITGKDIYDNDWREVLPLMNALPVIEAFPIANFFLKRSKLLKSFGTKFSDPLQAVLKVAEQSGQGLTRSMLSVHSRLYTHYQRVTLPAIVRSIMKN